MDNDNIIGLVTYENNIGEAYLCLDGKYESHCVMWYIPGRKYAYVEPVYTLPEYRKMGLGKAAVLEGVKRCGKLGADIKRSSE